MGKKKKKNVPNPRAYQTASVPKTEPEPIREEVNRLSRNITDQKAKEASNINPHCGSVGTDAEDIIESASSTEAKKLLLKNLSRQAQQSTLKSCSTQADKTLEDKYLPSSKLIINEKVEFEVLQALSEQRVCSEGIAKDGKGKFFFN